MTFTEAYIKEHGDANPSIRYITREGEKLGNWCSNTRRQYKRGKVPDDRVKRLEAMGFQWQIFESQWEEGCRHAEEYFDQNGDLNVPKRYICDDGFKLGLWLYTQKQVYKGKVKGILGEDQVSRLESLGILWKSDRTKDFDRYLAAYQAFKEEKGTPLVPYGYETSDGVGLGRWVIRMRRAAREGKLPKEQIARLDAIGFVWNNYDDAWMKKYKMAKEYYDIHHHLSIPHEYIKKHGDQLPTWLRNQKMKYDQPDHGDLSDEQVMLLEEIHIELRTRSDTVWMKGYAALKAYVKENGTTYILNNYVTDDGIKLGKWVSRMKTKYWNRTLSETQIQLLNKLDMDWRPNVEIRKYQNNTKI